MSFLVIASICNTAVRCAFVEVRQLQD